MNNTSPVQPSEIGTIVTEYIPVNQDRIDGFADVTEDRQWIHVDAERAEAESPFKCTIAHGFLTLAMIPFLLSSLLPADKYHMRMNYGLNRVRFLSPVRVGSRIRARARLLKCCDLSRGIERTWEVVLECERAKIPACVCEWVVRYYN